MTATVLRIRGTSYAVYDQAGAEELRARLGEPNRTILRDVPGCHTAWSDLYDEARALSNALVTLAHNPSIAGATIDTKWAGGVMVPPEYALRMSNWTRDWAYFKTTNCVSSVGLNVLVGSAVTTPEIDPQIEPLVAVFYKEPTSAQVGSRYSSAPPPLPDIVTGGGGSQEFEEEPAPGLGTGMKVALTVGALAAVGGLLWATTRKRR